jgi:hypothetical protein
MMQTQSFLRFRLFSSATTRYSRKTPPMIVTSQQGRCCSSRTTTRTCSSNNSNSSNSSSSSSNNSRLKMKEPLRPYSGSLPSPGYEWCRRCNIPSRKLQKAIGQHNPCLDLPTHTHQDNNTTTAAPRSLVQKLLLVVGRRRSICPAARQYYQQQVAYMAFFTALCFVALPSDFLQFGDYDDDDDDDLNVGALKK